MGSSNLEPIFDSVGHFGRYQIFLYFICAFQNISCGIHYLASVFLSVSPQHTCRPPGNVSQALFQDLSTWQLEDIWTQFSVGREDYILVQLQNGEIWELTSCQRSRRDGQLSLDYQYSGQKSSFPCLDGYIYDRSKWLSTVVTQWDLVCNREWFGRLIQPTFMFGVLLGAVIFGYLSDRCSGNSCLCLCVLGDGPCGEKKHSDFLPSVKRSDQWCDYGDPQGIPFLVSGGNYGWKIFHRGSVWPYIPLYSGAVSNHCKVAGCGEWQHRGPCGKHRGPVVHLSLQRLDLHATDTPIQKQKQWFKETFDHLFAIVNSAEAEDAGVIMVSGWQIFQSIPTEEVPYWADVVLGFRKMTKDELKKFPQHVFGHAFTTLKCEGPAYLPWLQKRVKGSGGLILTRRMEDLWELHPSFDIVVNCSGLGSRQLAGDAEIFPLADGRR
ncbi:D-aspartate oxidase isoform 5-T5 [Dama dama]